MSEAYVQKIVKVREEDAKHFDDLHPQHGAWSWWVREALRTYLDMLEARQFDPLEVIKPAMTKVVDNKDSDEENEDENDTPVR